MAMLSAQGKGFLNHIAIWVLALPGKHLIAEIGFKDGKLAIFWKSLEAEVFMGAEYVKIFYGGLERAFGLYEKFLAICPDDLWNLKAGGWPLSNQFYHGLNVSAKMLNALDGTNVTDPCPGGGELLRADAKLPTKADAAKYLQNIKQALVISQDRMTDAFLLENNTIISKMIGADIGNGGVLELMATHMLYHLGSCDAALRNAGREGAF